MERLCPFFPKSRGEPRVDDGRVLSGIIFIQRNGLMWKPAPADDGPPKTLCNRWTRWSRMGVFATIMAELAAQAQQTRIAMIDAIHAKAHRTASSLAVQKGGPFQTGDG
jgi:transposase